MALTVAEELDPKSCCSIPYSLTSCLTEYLYVQTGCPGGGAPWSRPPATPPAPPPPRTIRGGSGRHCPAAGIGTGSNKNVHCKQSKNSSGAL